MASKTFSKSLLLFTRFLLRRPRTTSHKSHGGSRPQHYRPPAPDFPTSRTIVSDLELGLLRSSSTFPYLMLVALEAGGLLRGLLLLLLYPLISCLGHETRMRAMVMVCFLGLRKKEVVRVGRAVLPKFFMECVGAEGFEVLMRGRRRVCVTSMPTVMVEGFVRGYLGADVVVGRELKVVGGYYTGLMEEMGEVDLRLEVFGSGRVTEDGVVGFGGCEHCAFLHKRKIFEYCKEVYMVNEAEKQRWHPLPRSKYPKPLVFHDGRIDFRPTPASTLCMFLWLPLGFLLAIARALVFIFLPYALSIPLLAFLGMQTREATSSSVSAHHRGRLYICNHRTLLDPLYIAAILRQRRVTATTYSLSRVIEWISPVKTIRLTRNREEDNASMKRLLEEESGDVVVCPEGTTCREPYLLRFSPLAAEVCGEVVPVALTSAVSMFYGTSTGKCKFMDPFYFLMNPIPCYEVEIMAAVSTGSIDGKECSSREMANHLQREIAKALGFECTSLTRKDKYLMLAGNEGRI
ncbi:hypothetical protein Cni_G25211 [Canna indica]|uniref:Phospholipid/glycerol acyltransferase domain-containing protein n=1 Tax=Canna indica TaxID=4628 RepID=A0AAQ3QM58_9LILI|nr:hypothetical protein Cni_G25211 [Canna indica]